MTVYLIRHAQTDANGRFYAGRADVPLNDRGHAEARALVEILTGHAINRILSSPLQRAMHTAAPLATARGLRVETVPALAELDFGDLQDKPKTSLAIRKAHLHTPINSGESLSDLWLRLRPVADALLLSERRYRNTAVVAHYWSLRLLAGQLQNMNLEAAAEDREFRMPNGAVKMLVPEQAVLPH